MGHTPGPWINSSGYITAKDGSEITDVAWSGSDPEGKANARLIGAAPDLLEAARLANQELIDLGQGSSASPALRALWSAIAKAEGSE